MHACVREKEKVESGRRAVPVDLFQQHSKHMSLHSGDTAADGMDQGPLVAWLTVTDSEHFPSVEEAEKAAMPCRKGQVCRGWLVREASGEAGIRAQARGRQGARERR